MKASDSTPLSHCACAVSACGANYLLDESSTARVDAFFLLFLALIFVARFLECRGELVDLKQASCYRPLARAATPAAPTRQRLVLAYPVTAGNEPPPPPPLALVLSLPCFLYYSLTSLRSLKDGISLHDT